MRTAFDAARKVLGDSKLHGADLTRAMTREIERLRAITSPGEAAAFEEARADTQQLLDAACPLIDFVMAMRDSYAYRDEAAQALREWDRLRGSAGTDLPTRTRRFRPFWWGDA